MKFVANKFFNLKTSFLVLAGVTAVMLVMIIAAAIYAGICNLDSSSFFSLSPRSNSYDSLTSSSNKKSEDDIDLLQYPNSFASSFSTLSSILEPRIAAQFAALAERRRLANENRAALSRQAIAEMIDKTVFRENIFSEDDVDWTVPRDEFIATWTARIDRYLKGSPLEGNGVHFATAAWDNVIDPRWSPAISNTESSKGAYCFLPYNAWGWGQSSFSSWEEAIKYHVAHLKEGYQYTISPSAAEKYCPPTHESWYNNTLNQMKMI